MTKIKLYEHQKEAVRAISDQFADGSRRTLAVLATGSGKTIIYLHLADLWMRTKARILILAHRRELIHQPLDRAEEFYPGLAAKMGVVMAGSDEPTAQVVIATIQTVSRDSGRLEALGKFDYVILDECHHGTAKSYMKLVEHFPDARWLGLTATPFRTDGDSLAEVFDSVAYRFPITTAIDRGTLVPFDAYGFSLPVSVEDLGETKYGWKAEDLGNLLSAANALEVVYEKWEEYCNGRSTICFTSSVAQAHATAEYFRGRGVSAEAVDGTTPKRVRDKVLRRFRSGNVQLVANCQVWTEGVDVPEASAALMVCPTKSDLAYVQKLGRVLRTFKGKENAIILDFAPLEDRNVIMAGDILGVPRRVKREADKAERGGLLVGVSRVDDHGLPSSVDPAVVVVEALKYLRKGHLAWTLQDYTTVATISEARMLVIELPDVVRISKAEELRKNGEWGDDRERLYQHLLQHRLWNCGKVGRTWKATLCGEYPTVEETIKAGEEIIGNDYRPYLAKKRGAWRRRPISKPQEKYMHRLGIKVPEACNCGQAAQLISFALADKAVEKARPFVETKVMQGD